MNAPVFTPKTPNHYAVGSKKIRLAGFKCVFRFGYVFVWTPGAETCWTTSIDGGKWMNHGDLGAAPWGEIEIPGHVPARTIERDCYCKSFPDGCDFCNNVRSCDGEAA